MGDWRGADCRRAYCSCSQSNEDVIQGYSKAVRYEAGENGPFDFA
jgi:hypothetical protein